MSVPEGGDIIVTTIHNDSTVAGTASWPIVDGANAFGDALATGPDNMSTVLAATLLTILTCTLCV